MLLGAPAELKVTLCCTVVPCHSHLTTVFNGTVIVLGVNELFATSTVETIAAVVVNVTAGQLGSAAAVAVAVCAPVPLPSVRVALAFPFAAVVFWAGRIVPPPVATAQSIVTPPLGFPCESRLCTVCVTCVEGGAVPASPAVFTIVTAVPAVALNSIVTGEPTRPVTVAVAGWGPAVVP